MPRKLTSTLRGRREAREAAQETVLVLEDLIIEAGSERERVALAALADIRARTAVALTRHGDCRGFLVDETIDLVVARLSAPEPPAFSAGPTMPKSP